MRIELTTSGGLTGRGVGSVTIDGADATIDGRTKLRITREEQSRLEHVARPESHPRRSFTPDAVIYSLTIDGNQWSWDDAAPAPECERWAEMLLAIRERALALDQTSSSM
ncbi:MAG TPA: hypothetical protein VF980_15990 [Thermoanaerobaculia bacterium]